MRITPLSDSEAQAWFELFTGLVNCAPTRSQDELIAASEMLFLQFERNPTSPAPLPSPAEPKQTAHAAAKAWGKIEAEYPVLHLRWTNQELCLEGTPEPLRLTRGLAGWVLAEVENKTSTPLDLAAAFDAQAPALSSLRVPAQARRVFVLPIRLNETAQSWTLRVAPLGHNEQARAAAVPIRLDEPAIVRGRLMDADTGKVFPGRVYASGGDNLLRFAGPNTTNTTLTEKPLLQFTAYKGTPRFYHFPFFYCAGEFEIALPAGKVNLMLERGFEHELATEHLNLKPGETREVTLRSGRMVDMAAQGWISGDTHVHWAKNHWSENEDIKLLALVQRAEDLRVANNLTLLQASGGPTFTAPTQYPMGPVPGHDAGGYLIQMGEEYRNDSFYGHLCFLNIKELIMPISTGVGSGGGPDALDWPLNKTAIEACHAQGGISTEAHGMGPFGRSDVPVNVIQANSDALDQLPPEEYYRFLNAGIQIPLANGSDHPARIAGCARVYVKVDGQFTYANWIEGIRKKRTFTTSGPLLFLSVNGREIGDTLDVKPGEELEISARAVSRYPLGTLQIVSNDDVIASKTVTGTHTELRMRLKAERSRWIVARASQNGNYNAITGPNIAHTSSIYVDVDGKPVIKPEAVGHWLALLDAHAENIKKHAKYSTEAQRQAQLDYIAEAKAKYAALLENGASDGSGEK